MNRDILLLGWLVVAVGGLAACQPNRGAPFDQRRGHAPVGTLPSGPDGELQRDETGPAPQGPVQDVAPRPGADGKEQR